MREINYKALTRWYTTPDKMNKIQPDRSSEFCRGCHQKGNMAYIWWNCIKIGEYWKEVQKYIKIITGRDIPNDPRYFFFII